MSLSFGSFLDASKNGVASAARYIAEYQQGTDTRYLAIRSIDSSSTQEDVLKSCFNHLNVDQQNQVYGKVWELAKMIDPRIDGTDWGKENAFKDFERLAKALHRLGFLGETGLHKVNCLPFGFGEGGLGAQYFSLGEKLGAEPAKGQIGLVNGMGMPCLANAGRDAAVFSDKFVSGLNVHCVYNSTHQNSSIGDTKGFIADVARMKALDGGSYSKTTYLIVQQWIDFLEVNPDSSYLQIGVSEGGSHVNAAVRLLKEVRQDLLNRLRILNLCPAYLILPEQYGNGIQTMNFIKREDDVVLPWATNASMIDCSPNIVVVPHTKDHPHNQLSDDFAAAAKPYLDQFLTTGNLY